MLALRWHARGDVRVEKVPPPPPPGPGEVQLRVSWCGICGTDVEEWLSGPVFIPAVVPHPVTEARAPLILRQRLLWVDILPGLVHRFDPATGGDDVFRAGKPVGAVGLRRKGGLVLAVEDGFALLDQDWQRLHQVAVIEHTAPRARFNDGKCDPGGRFLADTMAYDQTPEAGSLYRFDPDRSVTRLLAGVTISNGLAWSSDGTTLYHIDSPTQGIDALDYDLETGRLANRRRLVEIPRDAGLPDGMTIDEDGCLWVALYGGSAVYRYTPVGKPDVTVSFPATNITCPVFGGPGFGVLYVTSARDGLDDRQLAGQPHAGAVFAADVGTHGLPAPRFGG